MLSGILCGSPTPQQLWVRVGDRCTSAHGAIGTVLQVVSAKSVPLVVVRWDSGVIWRHRITTLKRVKPSSFGVVYPTLPE